MFNQPSQTSPSPKSVRLSVCLSVCLLSSRGSIQQVICGRIDTLVLISVCQVSILDVSRHMALWVVFVDSEELNHCQGSDVVLLPSGGPVGLPLYKEKINWRKSCSRQSVYLPDCFEPFHVDRIDQLSHCSCSSIPLPHQWRVSLSVLKRFAASVKSVGPRYTTSTQPPTLTSNTS